MGMFLWCLTRHYIIFLLLLNPKCLALWVEISADDILKYFSYFSHKTWFGISYNLSPMETICMECQILFFLRKIRKIFQYIICWISPESALVKVKKLQSQQEQTTFFFFSGYFSKNTDFHSLTCSLCSKGNLLDFYCLWADSIKPKSAIPIYVMCFFLSNNPPFRIDWYFLCMKYTALFSLFWLML